MYDFIFLSLSKESSLKAEHAKECGLTKKQLSSLFFLSLSKESSLKDVQSRGWTDLEDYVFLSLSKESSLKAKVDWDAVKLELQSLSISF